MSTLIPRGNVARIYILQGSVDVTSKSANTTAEQDVTVFGAKVGDVVIAVNKPSLSAGLGIVNARVKAADTISIQFGNFTGSPIDPAAETYSFVIARPENTPPVSFPA